MYWYTQIKLGIGMMGIVTFMQWVKSMAHNNVAVAVVVGCSMVKCECERYICVFASDLYIAVAKLP